MNSSNIEGKVIVITGASSGIGRATALHLASLGAKVALGARREDRLEDLAAEITEAGGSASWKATDVVDRESVQQLVVHARKTLGPVEVLINNAGYSPMTTLDKLRVDDWDRMIDVNIKGTLYGIAAVLPEMIERKQGHIVTTSSIVASSVLPYMTIYSATKHAVRALCEGLRREVTKHGIRVSEIAPGGVLRESPTDSDPEAAEIIKAKYEGIDLLEPIDIARAFAFAISQPRRVDVNEIIVRPAGEWT
ncbi:MAG: SDR family oxidoreductase [Myxococcota bacterium]